MADTIGEAMGSGNWSRDEFLVTLNLYLNEEDVMEDESDPQVRETAGLIGRSPGAVALRLANYRSLDPDGTKGMENTGEPCQEIWYEFYGSEDELAEEAAKARERLSSGKSEN